MTDDDDEDFATAMPPSGRIPLRPVLVAASCAGQQQQQQRRPPALPPGDACASRPPPPDAAPLPTFPGSSGEAGPSAPGPPEETGTWNPMIQDHLLMRNIRFGAHSRFFIYTSNLSHPKHTHAYRLHDLHGVLHAGWPAPRDCSQRMWPPVWQILCPGRHQSRRPVPLVLCESKAGRRVDPFQRGRSGGWW